jgi:CrcB protein
LAPTPLNLTLLALAGALGTLARYAVYAALPARAPLATLTVNVAGSFLFGLALALAARNRLTDDARVLICAGFLGAFTTFSAFAADTAQLLPQRPAAALLNIAANNTLSIAALLLALRIGR